MHAIVELQGALVGALNADADLVGLIGVGAVFDAPPKGRSGAYIVVARHDALARDGDGAPGHDHRVLLHVWHGEASRKAVLAVAERVVAVALGEFGATGLAVTHRQHVRTDTAIEGGQARAAVTLRFFSETG
ncbi:MAG: hypothetical protein JWR51_3662 [Devosia sp.]|uniref:tail completion protein gp17 n=1 Tax=Devosia sp. TaxID=1871048 RepID=UPI00262A6398|nr:DUF3168 domain-containing protein [Devosia sp.]MDB5530559.1 hypothetical protein [Devosia sp.]